MKNDYLNEKIFYYIFILLYYFFKINLSKMKTLILSFIKDYWLKILFYLIILFLFFISGWNCYKKLHPCISETTYIKRDSTLEKEIKNKSDSIRYLQNTISEYGNDIIKLNASKEADKKYYIKLINEYKKQNVNSSKTRIEYRYKYIQREDTIKKFCFDSVEIKNIDIELTERDMYKSQLDTCEKINIINTKQINLLNKSITMYQDVVKLQLEQIWKLESTPIKTVTKRNWYEIPSAIVSGIFIGFIIKNNLK